MLLGTASLGLVGPNAQAVAAGSTAARRIFDMMSTSSPLDSTSESGEYPEHVQGSLCFEQVNFAYPTRPEVQVLKKFSLRIPTGSTTALVGESGCGESLS